MAEREDEIARDARKQELKDRFRDDLQNQAKLNEEMK